jgi:hypothetical protein
MLLTMPTTWSTFVILVSILMKEAVYGLIAKICEKISLRETDKVKLSIGFTPQHIEHALQYEHYIPEINNAYLIIFVRLFFEPQFQTHQDKAQHNQFM